MSHLEGLPNQIASCLIKSFPTIKSIKITVDVLTLDHLLHASNLHGSYTAKMFPFVVCLIGDRNKVAHSKFIASNRGTDWVLAARSIGLRMLEAVCWKCLLRHGVLWDCRIMCQVVRRSSKVVYLVCVVVFCVVGRFVCARDVVQEKERAIPKQEHLCSFHVDEVSGI